MSTRLDQATVDLMGVLAYGELTAFERLASDGSLAPTIGDKHALASMAVAEFEHFRSCTTTAQRGHRPRGGMAPFVAAVDGFHDSTEPNDWLEGLIKAYVGDGLPPTSTGGRVFVPAEATRDLVLEVLADTGQPSSRWPGPGGDDGRPGVAGGSRCGDGAWSRGAHPGAARRGGARRPHRAARRRHRRPGRHLAAARPG
jgi:hypothetical protein